MNTTIENDDPKNFDPSGILSKGAQTLYSIMENKEQYSKEALEMGEQAKKFIEHAASFLNKPVSEYVIELFPDVKATTVKTIHCGPPLFIDSNNADNYSRKSGAMSSAWLRAEIASGKKLSQLVNPVHPQAKAYINKYMAEEKEGTSIECSNSEVPPVVNIGTEVPSQIQQNMQLPIEV